MVFALFYPAYSAAADPPPPPSEKNRLEALEKNLEQEKENQKTLQKKQSSLEKKLNKTKSNLVKLGKSIQSGEEKLYIIEKDIEKLENTQSDLSDKLKADQAAIADLILALQRLRRMPPEALILKPDAPLKTAQSALIMKNIVVAINQKAEMLRNNLNTLHTTVSDLETKHNQAISTISRLEKQEAELKTSLKKRETLYASVNKDLENQNEQIKKIVQNAKTLKDLIKKLEQTRRPPPITKVNKKPSRFLTSDLPKTGHPPLPVPGTITIRYNQPDELGAPSQGIKIQSRNQALVVAPMEGIVRFAGTFKNYGNMIIIEHENKYHSLIAGLGKIDTVVNRNVAAGEPIGRLNNTPLLYYELRQDGRPVDPSKKFGI